MVEDPDHSQPSSSALTWQPGSRVTIAACSGAIAAVAAGSTVWLLDLSSPNIAAAEPLSFPQQVSALALLNLASPQVPLLSLHANACGSIGSICSICIPCALGQQ